MSLHYYLATFYLPNVGPVKVTRYLAYLETLENLFTAPTSDLQAAGIPEKEIHAIKTINWSLVEKDAAWANQPNHAIITLEDSRYPTLLKELPGAPLVLFVKGNPALLAQPQIALVGTRNPSRAGREAATEFASALAQRGLVITSGLALGIDAAAHRGALAVSMPTLAVLGSGLNYIYPPSHRHLAAELIESGALVSEFSPAIEPIAKHFPRRNRIISGLSLGTVVIEAALRSGSLITARFAADQGRDVFAMPGSIHNPLAKGCHQLIRQGAKLIETADDILSELGPLWETTTTQSVHNKNTPPNLKDQNLSTILTQVDYTPTSLNTLILRSGLTAGEVSSMLLSLELEGYVDTVPGGYVRIT